MSIEIVQLLKTYGQQKAVNGISFTVGNGEIVGFLGPNGAGKSTTMKMLTGLLQPSSGIVLLEGRDIAIDTSRTLAEAAATRHSASGRMWSSTRASFRPKFPPG